MASNVEVTLENTFVSVDATAALRAWLTPPTANNGFLIEAAIAVTNVQFDSKENTNTSHPATLTITTSTPAVIAPPVGPHWSQGTGGTDGTSGNPATSPAIPGTSGQLLYNNGGGLGAASGIWTRDGNSLTATGTVTIPMIAIPGSTGMEPATLTTVNGSFLGITDPVLTLGLNTLGGGVRVPGLPAVWTAMEGSYATNSFTGTQRNYSEWYIQAADAAGKGIRPLAFSWDNGAVDNYLGGSLFISPNAGFTMARSSDGRALYTFGGDGIITFGPGFVLKSNSYFQTVDNSPITFITNGNFVRASNAFNGLTFGTRAVTNIYSESDGVLKTNSSFVAPSLMDTGLGTGIVHSSSAGLLSSKAVDLASADVSGLLPYSKISGTPQVPAGTVTNITTTGPITGGPITGTGTIACPTCLTITGNAATATALARAPTLCAAGHYPLGVNGSGDAQSCTSAGGGSVTSESIQFGGPTFSNSSSENTLFTFTVPAHEFAGAGYKLKSKVSGYIRSAGVNAISINWYIGGARVLTTGSSEPGLFTVSAWNSSLECTAAASPGPSVSLYCDGDELVSASPQAAYALGNESPFNLATNTPLIVKVTSQWTGANEGDSITANQFDSTMWH